MLKTKLLICGGGEEKLYSSDVFSTHLYTGNGSTQTINNGVDLAGEGGMVWVKGRGTTFDHFLYDTNRGVGNDINSNSTSAQVSLAGSLSSFNSNGFGLGSQDVVNYTGLPYASWTFRNADRFFTHTTISHTNGTPTNIGLTTLGTVGQVIAKITNITGDWITWHRSLTAGNNLRLNAMSEQTTTNAWLSVSGTTATLSASAPTGTYVVYGFAHDTSADGIIQCGSFTTNASGNATVTTGWEPQFIESKAASASESWRITDIMRGMPVADRAAHLFPNLTAAENSINNLLCPTATGFNVVNFLISQTYIYLAIRRPNKPPTTATEVFQSVAYTSTNVDNRLVETGIVTDMVMTRPRAITASLGFLTADRLRGDYFLGTASTNAEATDTDTFMTPTAGYGNSFSATNGYGVGNDATYDLNYLTQDVVAYAFKRAPGFFDVVCYTGTGVARTVPHGLGVAPELMIVKNRNGTNFWAVYSGDPTGYMALNLNNAFFAPETTLWNATAPTAAVFTVGTNNNTNESGRTFVAYLFATLDGISKVGSYTGNGTTQTIDCGFSAGARFFLVKSTSTTGSWWIFDSARGIVSSFDPALQLNSTAAEITSADAVDPAANGIVVNQEATCSINATGVSYVYLAIS